jgi:hypothetical protein
VKTTLRGQKEQKESESSRIPRRPDGAIDIPGNNDRVRNSTGEPDPSDNPALLQADLKVRLYET